MRPSITQVGASALLFLSAVQGHMIMKSPVPYGPAPDSSPLIADGSNFPCKGSQYTVVTENTMAIGEPQTLSFTGSAVHGGGSCQVSLTTDRAPTKDSKWMVIKSIEGGCPASVAGNLPADPSGSGASTFQYTIPDGIAPGQYTIAWTWFNKIGNREMYMNCGPATVTGAKKKRYAPQGVSLVRKQTSFPDLFVANLAGINQCATTEGFDYNFPNPGAAVQSAGVGPYTQLACSGAGSGGNAPAAAPTASAQASGAAPAGSSAAVPTQSSAPMASSAVAASPSAVAPSQSAGGIFASGAAGSAPAATASAASAPVASASAPVASAAAPVPAASAPASAPAAPAPAASAAPASPASSGTTSVSGAQTPNTPCSSNGLWVCIDGKSFQQCASGIWQPIQSMAAGMKCTPGSSDTFNQYAGKRSLGGWVRRATSFKA